MVNHNGKYSNYKHEQLIGLLHYRDNTLNGLEEKIKELENENKELKKSYLKDKSLPYDCEIYTKNFFEEYLKIQISECNRTGKKLAVLNCDMDKFKQINDKYGHDTGDKVLTAGGNFLKKYTRKNDAVFRIGGDEFAIVISNSNPNALIHKLKNNMDNYDTKTEQKIKLSMSIGAAVYDPKRSSSVAVDQKKSAIKKIADENMYRMKNSVYESQ